MGALMVEVAELAGILSRMGGGQGIDPAMLDAASEHAAILVIEAMPRLREEVQGIAPPAQNSELAYRSAKLGNQYRDEWLKAHA